MNDAQNNDYGKVKASPAARRVAKELGIDLSEITASSVDGRIQLDDVENYHEEILQKNAPQKDVVDEIYEIIRAREELNSSEAEPEFEIESQTEIEVEIEAEIEPEAEIPTEEEEAEIETDIAETVKLPVSTETDLSAEEAEYIEADEYEFAVPPSPVYISFSVSDENIRNMLGGLDVNIKSGLINVVIKACGCALIKTDAAIYEDKVNVMSLKGREVLCKTAVKAQDSKISEIKLIETDEADDILINIWDLTDFGFTGFKKADIDTLNLFVLWNEEKIIVELACDEFIMDIAECAQLMDQLKKFLMNPSYMLL